MGNKRIEKKKAKMRKIQANQTVPKPDPLPASKLPETKAGTKTLKPSFFLQYGKKQAERTELLNAVKQWWKAQGYLVKDLKEVNLYAKPAEGMVYFTINDSVQGSLPIPFMSL
ncbi:MAG: DUF6465 family protein [Lachnospiraceae bacterium]